MAHITVISYDDPFTLQGRQVTPFALGGDDEVLPLSTILERTAAMRGWDPAALDASIAGVPIPRERFAEECAGHLQTVVVGRRIGLTGGTLALIAIAIASAAASAYLVSRVKVPRPTSSSDAAARRYGFTRVSSDALNGDPIPVVFGHRPRYGGKVVAKTPVDAEDGSGDSVLKLLILLGWGPIQSIGSRTADFDRVAAADITGLYINDQPISAFPRSRVSGRLGTSGQAIMPGFEDAELTREVGVGGVDLVNTSGSERTGSGASGEAFTYSTLDEVNDIVLRVRLANGLYSISNSGQVGASSVKYRYRTRTSDTGSGAGAWSSWTVITLERADQSEFYSAPRIALSADNPATTKYDVQAERVSVDSSNAAVVDKLVWDSVTEITHTDNNYAGMAMLAVELTAGEQLSTIPSVSVDVKGLKNLRIWDGVSSPSSPVFTTGYSENPAWHALEFITNATWGLGASYGDTNVNMPRLIEAAQEADLDVSRPGGGTRKKYRCHLVLGEQRDGVEWLRTICRTMEAVPVPVGDVWDIVVDKAQSNPVEVFGDGSIAVDEQGIAKFSYKRELGTGGLTRPNRFTSQFENEQQDGRPDTIGFPELGELWLGAPDNEDVQGEDVRLDGVTDPDQVMSHVVRMTKRARYLTRSVRFETTRPVVAVQPGDRFDIAMSLPGWGLASGRVMSGCTTTTLKLDRSVTLAAATTYTARVVHLDGSVEVKTISSAAGTYAAGATITLASALTQAPGEFAEYVIGQINVDVKPFLCSAVRVADTKRLAWEIEGIEYAADVYNDNIYEVTLPNYSTLNNGLTPPGPVRKLAALERQTPLGRRVELAWTQDPQDAEITASYRIFRRLIGTGSWLNIPEAVVGVSRRGAVIELYDLDLGYEFCVIAVSIGGAALSPDDPRVLKVGLVLGLSEPAPELWGNASFTQLTGNTYRFSYDRDAGPVEHEAVEFVICTGGDAGDLVDCMVVERTTELFYDVELTPGLACRWFVRAVGANGRMTLNAIQAAVSSPATPPGQSIKLSRSFALDSEGTRTNLTWDSGDSRLELTDPDEDGVYLTPEIDTGSLSMTELTFRLLTANATLDPTISAAVMGVPGLEADQWGVVATGPHVVGMLAPPYPDQTLTYGVRVRTHDGTAWGDWSAWQAGTSINRMLRYYQAEITIARSKDPYRPAIRALDVVATH
ncbi:MAG: hypothetical protein AMXMBFR58_29710 [Phycisphaerae bacterium]